MLSDSQEADERRKSLTHSLPLSNSTSSLHSFLQRTGKTSIENMRKKIDDLISTASDLPPLEKKSFAREMDQFLRLFTRLIAQRGDGKSASNNSVDWSKIVPLSKDLQLHSELSPCPSERKSDLLDKLAVLKLNGGLGTTMGCVGPKSTIEVHSGFTFLDLTVHQIEYLNNKHDANVPLLLMNSFNTDEATKKILAKYEFSNLPIHSFNQSRYPRIYVDTLTPVPTEHDSHKSGWYPPGHGDVYPALYYSGLVDAMLSQGRRYLFISNVDNLGATVDFSILNYIVENNVDFLMEVTNKTRSDVKGGTLIGYEGKTKLLEIAQVPKAHVEEFKSIKKFKIFNTNNLWVDLEAVKRFVEEDLLSNVDVIENRKTLNGRGVIQLERAAGAAIQYFDNAKGVNVPRKRFLPVKQTSDLFLIQSNLYTLKKFALRANPLRDPSIFPTLPTVKLGDMMKTVKEYQARFKTIPDLVELDHLTISGDVTFGRNVTLRGTVIIVANHGSRIDIPDNAVLENKVVSGNLRILDH